MNTPRTPPGPVGAPASAAGPDVLWHHRAFCGLALPLRSTKEPWSRHAGGASITIEPNAPDGPLPSGKFLRLALLRICDAAVRARAPAVDLGDGPSAWAAALGIEPSGGELRDLAARLERLAGSRMAVSVDHGPALTVFDARSRPRAGDGGLVSNVRLNSRFLTSLLEQAVPLSRAAVRGLWRTPEVLDAYAWAVQELHRGGRGAGAVGWDELRRRFGPAARDETAFRTSFDEALQAAATADPSIAVAIGDAGVEVRASVFDVPSPLPHVEQALRGDLDVAAQQGTPKPVEPPVDFADTAGGSTTTGEAALVPRSTEPAGAAAAAPAVSDVPDPVSLSPRQTGLPGVIWLRRGSRSESPLVGVTPGSRLDVERLTVLAVEPMVLQVEGGLSERDFALVSRWIMVNRDLIDDLWEGGMPSLDELAARVKPLRADTPG